jgi:uncharacterized protein YbjQ (UPF0145 family)
MWECKKCLERVEDSFEVCWNCGTSKDGVEDPLFQREAEAETDANITANVHRAGAPRSVDSKRKRGRKPVVTTGNEVAGRTIAAYLGIVRGIVVRSPTIGQGIMGGLQQLVGGNNETYAEVCEAARRDAFDRMRAHARAIKADAVIGMRYDATEFAAGVTEVLAYGTAVKLARK